MTNAPHLLPKSRSGYKYGSVEMLDAMAYDGLTDVFDNIPMGESTDNVNTKLGITREEQDEFAARSHQRAAVAQKNGVFDEEITPVSIPQRKGDPIEFREDEGIRADTTAESLAKLRPAFTKDGTITAGTSSQISDGAAAVVVMSKAKAEELGPELARRDRRARQRRRPGQLAAVAAVERDQGRAAQGGPDRRRPRPDRDQRGVRRGRHPVDEGPRRRPRRSSTSTAARSRSATRSACPARGWRCTLALELKRRGGGTGAAALCGGGGQGDALILHVPGLSRRLIARSDPDAAPLGASTDVADLVARTRAGETRAGRAADLAGRERLAACCARSPPRSRPTPGTPRWSG